MNLTKFEVYGIGFSIAALVLALWIVRLEMTVALTEPQSEQQSASVFVGENENQRAAVADALTEASDAGQLSRLIIDDVIISDGEVATEGDMVTVNYIGSLQNGQQFENSYREGEPFTFELGAGRVIEGWDQGIEGMRVGGQRILVIPPHLAYGSEGSGPIPPDATLVFAIELIAVE